MLRPAGPMKTRLTIVSSGAVRASASAPAWWIAASGQRRNPVPTCTALAPRASATSPTSSCSAPSAKTALPRQDLGQVMLQVFDVVAHEVLERRGLALAHRLPGDVVKGVRMPRARPLPLRRARHDV